MTTLIVKSIKSLKNRHLYLYRRSPKYASFLGVFGILDPLKRAEVLLDVMSVTVW